MQFNLCLLHSAILTALFSIMSIGNAREALIDFDSLQRGEIDSLQFPGLSIIADSAISFFPNTHYGNNTIYQFEQITAIGLSGSVGNPGLIELDRVETYFGGSPALDNIKFNPIPEPASMLLVGTGLIVLAGIGRKKFLKKKDRRGMEPGSVSSSWAGADSS